MSALIAYPRAEKPRYPRKAHVERFIALARACGIDVAGFEVFPNGAIRIMETRAAGRDPASDFDRFMDKL